MINLNFKSQTLKTSNCSLSWVDNLWQSHDEDQGYPIFDAEPMHQKKSGQSIMTLTLNHR